MSKIHFPTFIALCSSLLSVGCQSGAGSGGTSPTPSPAPTPAPTPVPTPTPTPESGTLANYVKLLTYTTVSDIALRDDLTQLQQIMTLTESTPVKNISVNFYSDSQCTTLASTVSLDGYAILLPGSYTTTTDSNLSICSLFQLYGNIGCVYEYSYTQSLNFVVNPINSSKITGSCMTNPAWNGEKMGYYNLSGNWSRNCGISSSCGFSQNYTMELN